MSHMPQRDAKLGAGPWLIFGGVVAVLGFALFSGARAVQGLLIVSPPGRRVKMPGGSTAENFARLVEAFGPLVVDQGNGVYSVSVASQVTATNLPGAKVL